jgi:alpha-galactosidase
MSSVDRDIHMHGKGWTATLRSDGKVDLELDGAVSALGMVWRVTLADGRVLRPGGTILSFEDTDAGTVCRVPLGDGVVSIRAAWSVADGALTCGAVVENTGGSAVGLREAAFETGGGVDLAGGWARWFIYKMGFNVAARSGSVSMATRETSFFLRFPPFRWLPGWLRRMLFNEGTRFSSTPGCFQSEWLTMLTSPGGADALVAGFSGVGRHFSQVMVDGPRGDISLVAQLDDVPLAPGGRRELDPLHFGPGKGTGTEPLLQGYARALAREHGARINPARIWCSWYSGFYDRISEEGLLANLDLLKESGAPVDCFQLDDGYQAAIGDWLETNERFPGGLEALARRIGDAGFRPGLWTAPFAVSPGSRVFREHPDWVVRNRQERPVRAGFIMGKFGPRFYYGLDTTRDDVLGWIQEVYSRLGSMGWSLFKIDFLTAACVAGERANPSMTRAQAYRRGLEAVRRGIGDDALLLSGIGPILANAGMMDIQRLGPDTSFGTPAWRTWLQKADRDRMSPGLANNTAGSLSRAFTNDILWSGDGDAILQQDLPENESRFLATVSLLLGSTTTIGHDFRRGAFDFTAHRDLGPVRGPARVLDRGERSFPRHFVAAGDWNGANSRFYGLLNPTDRDMRVNPRADALGRAGAVEVLDYWVGGITALDPAVPVSVPARSARLFIMKS